MILIDTSFWISLLNTNDSNHQNALQKFSKIDLNKIYILDQIYAETLSVLRLKISDKVCNSFINLVNEINAKILFPSKKTFAYSELIFKKFGKLSFADASILATSQVTNAELISFDKRMNNTYKQLHS